jgi:hypothetical protein
MWPPLLLLFAEAKDRWGFVGFRPASHQQGAATPKPHWDVEARYAAEPEGQ